jgi:GAF domain-containing protein
MTYPLPDLQVAKTVRVAAEIADAYGASLYLVRGDVLRPYVIYNLPEEYIAGCGEIRVGSQCCGRAVAAKKPWIVTDMLEDPLFAEGLKGAENSLIRAAFSVPVFQGGNVIACLACHYTAPHTPSTLDIDRNEHFARIIAIILEGHGAISLGAPIFVQPLDSLAANAVAL